MTPSTMYPVQVLREHVTALEAALSVCLADPDHKPVHRLRTETRRVEALLTLLELIPSLPEHRKPSAQLLRSLKKLRRAAGVVRDLDVHRKLLEGLASSVRHETAPEPVDGDAETVNAAILSDSAGELRARLGRERLEAANQLKHLLHRRQAKTARAAEALLEALEPAKDFALPGPALLRNADLVLTRDGLLKKSAARKLNEDELHTVRKDAKRARYLAETLPEDALVAAAAQRFEALQEAGGEWHDALELAQAARQHFGKAHLLTALYRREREQKLEGYRDALVARAAELPDTPVVAAPKREGVVAKQKSRPAANGRAARKGVRRSATSRAAKSAARQKTAG